MEKSKVEKLIDKFSDIWADDGVCAEKEYYLKHLRKLVEFVKNEKE